MMASTIFVYHYVPVHVPLLYGTQYCLQLCLHHTVYHLRVLHTTLHHGLKCSETKQVAAWS
jgi:hypothetical protein